MLYLIYTAVPFKAVALGAGPFELGSLAAISTGTYAFLAAIFGRLSDRVSRTGLARITCVGVIMGCICLTLAPSVGWMMLCIPLIGGSLAPFWPSVQASIGDRSSLAQLERNLGRFNLSWSTGKALGYFVGGLVVATFGVSTTFTIASFIAFAIFFVLPGPPPRAEAKSSGAPLEGAPDAPLTAPLAAPEGTPLVATALPAAMTSAPQALDARAAAFRRLAWIANGTAFGVSATLTHHYPRLIAEFGWSARIFGAFLALVYLTQTAAFAVLMWRPETWRFQRLRLYAVQALVLVCVLALPFADKIRVFVSALLIGIGLGTCYYSSIYYSLHTHAGRGRHAGVHEGLIGLGSMLIPFLGGVAAIWSHHLAAPYTVAAGTIAIGLVAQEWMYRRSSNHRER